jgi:hypothetical protein
VIRQIRPGGGHRRRSDYITEKGGQFIEIVKPLFLNDGYKHRGK